MQAVVNMLLSKIKEHNPDLNDAQLRSRRYGIEVFLNELSKTIIFVVLFAAFSLVGYFLMGMLIYCTLRTITGGYHAGSYWACLAVSLAGFAVPIFSAQYIDPGSTGKTLILLAALIITIAIAPVSHKNTPKKTLPNKQKFRILSIVLVIFWSVTTYWLPGAWSVTAVFIILTEAIMQILGKLFNPVLERENGVREE
jgi:accessory gene regulator B